MTAAAAMMADGSSLLWLKSVERKFIPSVPMIGEVSVMAWRISFIVIVLMLMSGNGLVQVSASSIWKL